MKTYQVRIGKDTRKGNFQELHSFCCNSEGTAGEVQRLLALKYLGFSVSIVEVETIDIDIPNDTRKEEKETKSTVKKKESDYSDGEYIAKIYYKEIPGYEKLAKRLQELREETLDEEEKLKKEIMKLYGLERCQNFRRDSEAVSFSYYSSWFDFQSKLTPHIN